jgi:hypothetical protein
MQVRSLRCLDESQSNFEFAIPCFLSLDCAGLTLVLRK